MHASGKRRAIIRNNGVVTGSVWDTRIKMDEFEGGIKVFNAGNGGRKDEGGMRVYRRLRRNQSDAGADTAERRKRRSWKPPEPVGSPCIKNHGKLRKARSELSTSSKICNAKEEEEEEEEDEIEIEIEEEEEVKSFDDKEIVVAIKKPEIVEEKVEEEEKKAKNVVVEEIHPIPDMPILPDIEKKQNHVAEIAIPASIGVEEEMFETGISGAQNKMQNIVDLVMWRDISKSAFVFGFGSFLLLSSSYAKDLNFSLISAISYLGLVYLAMIFLYKSILRRGSMEFDERNERHLIGEEEAIWALRFLLPYINEVLLKIRALFSGDPATTMKLALLLFALARSGGSITTWTLAKLIFFGVFTIPKVLSTYSVQLAKYGKFWLERFRDGWESCTHKKAVAAGVFTLIWNLSSAVARIWAVFMLVVAVKLYQQCVVAEQWNGEEEMTMEKEEERQEDSKAGPGLGQATRITIRSQHRQRNGPRPIDVADRQLKLKKWT